MLFYFPYSKSEVLKSYSTNKIILCKSILGGILLKKLNFVFIILLFFLTLIGCNFQEYRYINFSMKPNNHYYIDQIRNKLLNEKKFTLHVFDTNLYKEIKVSPEDNAIVEDFISSLTKDSYSDEKINLKEPFRLKITFDDNNIYLIKVFNDSAISISPWDGIYPEDIISIKDLPLKYNLFDFCNHILNNPISKQK